MNNKVEIYVNGPSSGTTQGQIELYGDEPISLTYSITDIKDITKRNSTYSESFTVPATKNNNILFNHIFNIGSDSSFDPSKKTPAYLLVDSLMVIQGNLQLLKIKVKNKNPESYDVIIYGEAIDLVKSLGDKELTSLDFSELNHIGNTTGITHSWSATTSQLGYYYPLIDYGYDLDLLKLNVGVGSIVYQAGTVSSCTSDTLRDNSKNWISNAYINHQINIVSGTGSGQVRNIISNSQKVLITDTIWSTIPDASSTYEITQLDSSPWAGFYDGLSPAIFKPAISNKYLFDKIFNTIGYTYTSEFLNSEKFTETIIPYNNTKDIELSLSAVSFLQFAVSTSSNSTGVSVFTPNFNINDNNPNGYYNNTTKRYTSPINAGMRIGFQTTYSYSGTPNPYFNDIVVKFYRTGFYGGSYPFYEEQARTDPNTVVNVKYNLRVETPILDDQLDPAFFPAQAGEQFWVTVQFNPFDPAVGLVYWAYDPLEPQYYGTAFYNTPTLKSVDGGYVDFNGCIPKKVKQIDYIKSIITMFNLLVIPSNDNPKNLQIIPRQDYFSQGVIKDWSSKLDVSFPIEETVISEQQNKQIQFSYKPDKDYLNTFYTDKTQKIYGEYIQTIDNEWLATDSKQKIEVIFSPTPMENVGLCNDIIVPKIGKVDNNGAFGSTDSNLRFLRKNPTLMPTLGSTIKMKGQLAQASYPYAGHLNEPFTGDTDYNFGTIDKSYFDTPGYENLQQITPNNLINSYWKEYLDDISDKNSKLIKCKLKLTATDIAQFNYNDSIYIDGLTDDGGHYFTVNKITYIPTSDDSSLVELIKVNRIPTIKNGLTSVELGERPLKRNSLSLGGSEVRSSNSIGIGERTFIDGGSDGSFVTGFNNYVGKNSFNTSIQGNNNLVGNNVLNSFIVGSSNTIGSLSATTGTTSISGVTLLGVSNYTATTSDTVYVPNIQFTSSAGTINGTSISAITQSATLWASGTGISSVVQINIIDPNIASGGWSLAIGEGSLASGITSYAEGSYTQAIGTASHSEGSATIASGTSSHAEGFTTIASGPASHAEGSLTTASGYYSHAEGEETTASGYASHAEGRLTTAGGYTSHAEGSGTTASGNYSHAEGDGTLASGHTSHAEGSQTTALGNYSHSEGFGTTSIGIYSHAGGDSSVANGNTSFVHGKDSEASGSNTIVLGESITGSSSNTTYVENLNIKSTKSIRTSNGGGQLDLDYGGYANILMLSSDSGAFTNGLYMGNDIIEGTDFNYYTGTTILSRKPTNLETSFINVYDGKIDIGVTRNIGGSSQYISGIYIGQNYNTNVYSNQIGLGLAGVLINSTNSVVLTGVTNSVVIGGTNLSATTNNTVYVENLNVNGLISGTTAIGIVTTNSGGVSINSTTGNVWLDSQAGGLILNRLTTTERNALTAINGMLIYNTTLNKFQGYENGAWANLI